MKRPHATDDVRERALASVDDGYRVADVAVMFRVGPSTIRRWRRQRARTGTHRARHRPGRTRLIGPADEPALRAQIAAHPDATLCGLAGEVGGSGECAHDGTGRAAAEHHAQKKTLIAREQDVVARTAWRAGICSLDPARLSFPTEPALRGRSRRYGKRSGRSA